MLRVRSTWALASGPALILPYYLTVIVIGRDSKIQDVQQEVSVRCLALTSSLGPKKRHETVSKSSTEAEYMTMSAAASEIVWLQNLLRITGLQQQRIPLLLCDNLSAVCLTANPMFHKRTKHFDVDYHYVRESGAESFGGQTYSILSSACRCLYKVLESRSVLQAVRQTWSFSSFYSKFEGVY